MSCREDMKPYLSPEGFPCQGLNPSQPNGNSLLFLAHYAYCLKVNKELSPDDARAFYEIVTLNCQIVPGFFRRNKSWPQDLEQRDDYYALAYLSRLFNWPIAKEILDFGRSHKFKWGPISFSGYFPNTDFDPLSPTCTKGPLNFTSGKNASAFLWRDRGLLACTRWSAGESPSPTQAAWWDYATAYGGSQTDQDGYLLGYLQIETAKGRDGFDKEISDIFYGRLLKDWGTMNRIFSTYLGDANHPFAKWWKPSSNA